MLKLFPLRWLGILLAFVLLVLLYQALAAQSDLLRYYYYRGTRIPLRVAPDVIAVDFGALSPAAQQRAANATGDVENPAAGVPSPIGGLTFLPLRPGRDPLAAVARFRAQTGVRFASPVYVFDDTQLAETTEFLARFKSVISAERIALFNQQNNVALARPQPNSDRVLVLTPNANNPRTARELANLYVESGLVDFAEPNFVIRQSRREGAAPPSPEVGTLTPNDPGFGLQWSLKNTRQFQGSLANADINATRGWGVTQGATSLKIAVIDEGVDSAHPDLSSKLLNGYNAINGTNNTNPKPNDRHGTAVAGIAAAASNNGLGMAGVCWFCPILPVKIAETDSQGNWVTSTAILASGIDWAWQNGADVLNNSWTMNAPSEDVELAIINARFGGRGGKGSALVFAAGNQDASSVAFPASLNSYVIAVGASNWCDQRKTRTNDGCNNQDAAWGSNYGSALDLVAPGEAIYTACNGNQCTNGAYTYLSGTSMSAPLVSGAVALLYSLNPDLTPAQAQQVLQNGAQDIGAPGRDNETGYGRLDVYRAISYLYNLALSVTDGKTLVRPGEVVNYTLAYANTGSAAMGSTTLQVTLPPNTSYVSSTPAFSPSGSTYALNLGALPGNTTGSATFRVRVLPSAAGQLITLNASISGAFPEANTTDNAASDTSLGIQRQLFLPLIQKNAVP